LILETDNYFSLAPKEGAQERQVVIKSSLSMILMDQDT